MLIKIRETFQVLGYKNLNDFSGRADGSPNILFLIIVSTGSLTEPTHIQSIKRFVSPWEPNIWES